MRTPYIWGVLEIEPKTLGLKILQKSDFEGVIELLEGGESRKENEKCASTYRGRRHYDAPRMAR